MPSTLVCASAQTTNRQQSFDSYSFRTSERRVQSSQSSVVGGHPHSYSHEHSHFCVHTAVRTNAYTYRMYARSQASLAQALTPSGVTGLFFGAFVHPGPKYTVAGLGSRLKLLYCAGTARAIETRDSGVDVCGCMSLGMLTFHDLRRAVRYIGAPGLEARIEPRPVRLRSVWRCWHSRRAVPRLVCSVKWTTQRVRCDSVLGGWVCAPLDEMDENGMNTDSEERRD
ncbi:hypothetical protein BC826DRAFT_1045211 [Russula brevipes]|nr:hypothetical protein BC826DRAFT_1045211 [Russula brevipes]